MTTNGGTTYVYDAENRLIWTTGGYRYVYDGDGKRVEKCEAGTATTACPTSGTTNGTLYWMGTGSAALDESNLSGGLTEQYVFFGGTRVARRDISTSAVHYYFSDHLGSHDVVANATGTATEQDIDYYPYGGEQEDYSTAPVAQNYKFTGKERDSESGLDDFGARYDASSLGRFMSADPDNASAFDNVDDPQSWNGYAYARNNPTTLADPDGRNYHICVAAQDGDHCFDFGTQEEYQALYDQQNGKGGINLPEPGDIDFGAPGNITCGGIVCGTVAKFDPAMIVHDDHIIGGVAAVEEGIAGVASALKNGIVNTIRDKVINTFAPNINTTINSRQGRHVIGSEDFDPGKSELTADPNELANSAGTGQQVNSIPVGQPGSKERIDFGKVIGIYKDKEGNAFPTTKAIIHYAADGIHIVPARP